MCSSAAAPPLAAPILLDTRPARLQALLTASRERLRRQREELEKIQQQQAVQAGEQQGLAPAGELNLPSPPAAQLEQKIELPENASPEAVVGQ